MLLFIIVIVCLVALVVYGNKLRRNAHKKSFDAYAGGLNKDVDPTLDSTLTHAKVIAMENGIDLNK